MFNQKIYKEALKMPRPQMANLMSLDRAKSYGQESIQPQLNQINQYGNQATQPISSDAKLNVARNLAVNANINENKLGLMNKLSDQNRQVEAQNLEIGQKERLGNAQIAEQNAGKMDAYNRMRNNLELQKLAKAGETWDTYLSKKQGEGEQKQANKQSIIDENEYADLMTTFSAKHQKAAKDAGIPWTEYYTAHQPEIEREKNQLMRDFKMTRVNRMKSGGTIGEKVEVENVKGDKQQQLEILRNNHKKLELKLKLNEKAMDRLGKDNSMLLKKIIS